MVEGFNSACGLNKIKTLQTALFQLQLFLFSSAVVALISKYLLFLTLSVSIKSVSSVNNLIVRVNDFPARIFPFRLGLRSDFSQPCFPLNTYNFVPFIKKKLKFLSIHLKLLVDNSGDKQLMKGFRKRIRQILKFTCARI